MYSSISPIAPCRKSISLYVDDDKGELQLYPIELTTSYFKNTADIELVTLQRDLTHLLSQPFMSEMIGLKTSSSISKMSFPFESIDGKIRHDTVLDATVKFVSKRKDSLPTYEVDIMVMTETSSPILQFPEKLQFYNVDADELQIIIESDSFHEYLRMKRVIPPGINENSHIVVAENGAYMGNIVIRFVDGPSKIQRF